MSSALLHLILLIFLLPLSAVAQSNGTVSVGASLTATDNLTPWLSSSREFAFGFQKIQGNDLFLLSIWYDNIPDKTIIWYPHEAPSVPGGSRVELSASRGLVLSDPRGIELWASESVPGLVAYGVMNDTGNFELFRSGANKVWQSFDYPTDTMLPTQMMERGGVMYSRMSESNFSRGRFQFRLLQDGNLVLNTRDILSDYAYDAYYRSDTFDPANELNSGNQLIFNETGYMYVLRGNGRRSDLTPRMSWSVSDYYHRATLNFDGVFAQYYHPKNFTNGTSWTQMWTQPDNICVNIDGGEGSGACGYNNVCSLDDNSRPICECPESYSLLDPNDPYGSCKPSFVQSCDEAVGNDIYDFVELVDTDWPTSDYVQMNPTTEVECKSSCLNDCFCAVAIYRGTSCWRKKLPLSNGRKDRVVNGRAFLKFRKNPLPPPGSPYFPVPKEKRYQKGLILVGSVLLGSSVFVNFVLIFAACIGFFLIYRNKIKKPQPDRGIISAVETSNLLCFSYQELVEATNGFKEELGRGAFGIVYKGVIGASSGTIVAVKKLDRVVHEVEKEFKTEVNVIGRTHHKNLVRLLGFCHEGENRLLVYEYMSNGTLASFLFGEMKPGWEQRKRIALGTARGLSYLHEECSTQIIHCDIKPQNVLLDDYYNARISDFGLAKLLMINQSRTHTAIRGTKGYVAPEWFRNTPITAKVDVYSFGVLLLEIVSCRRSLEDLDVGGEEKAILTDWVWDCYQERRLDVFVENDSETSNDLKKMEMFVKVGIWCIQEDPSLRPTMRKVIQMLDGVIEVTEPPCPSPFSVTSYGSCLVGSVQQ